MTTQLNHDTDVPATIRLDESRPIGAYTVHLADGTLAGGASFIDALTVVPVCPLLAAHIERHGAEFLADGGRFRQPTRADITLVTRLMASDG